VNFPFASSLAVARLREWLPGIGTPESLDITLAFATWPRGWQADAAGWLDRPAQGGFTREVGSHFLFLARRLLGPLVLHEAAATFPDPARAEHSVRATFSAGPVPGRLVGGVGTTTQDDHNLWTLTGTAGAIRLRDWSVAERLVDGVWQTDPDALPNARMRPMVLQRQLAGVAAMTRGGTHELATLAEAFEVQQTVEAILAN
jgi:predicted dehydrogenase